MEGDGADRQAEGTERRTEKLPAASANRRPHMSTLELDVDGFGTFVGDLLKGAAPASVDAMREFLPLESELMHVRWSGHATWINIDEVDLPEVPRENHTAYPSRGDVLLYPGYRNEQEILVACGPTCFKSPAGELAAVEEATLADGVHDVAVRIVD